MNAVLQTLRNLGPVRLAVIIGVGITLIAFFVFLLTRLGNPDMALLYGDLNPQDAGQIDQRLTQMNVPHDLRSDGSQIFVPTEQVSHARVTLAAEGLPTGGSIGYEIFDKSQSLATSSFVQNINQLRATEGELSRTIGGIQGVRSARVHLVLPQRELFSRERMEPSAAILVHMDGPRRLERGQVAAIQHIVATSVPGLKPDRVSIVDERGTLLAQGVGDSNGAVTLQSMAEMRTEIESRLGRQVEALLERTLGPEKVRAEVNAEIDMSRSTENQELFNPDQQVVRSTQTVSDNSEQTEADTNPSVTIANNLPAGQAQNLAPASNASKTARNEETINYEISKTSRALTREPGAVKRLSVAVLVDGTYTADAQGKMIYTPRPAKELDQIKALVESAIGYDAQRGDEVQVVNLQFASSEEDRLNAPRLFGLDRAELARVSEILVLGVIGILVLFLVVRPLIARLFDAMPQATTAAGASAALIGPPGLLQRQLAAPGMSASELAMGDSLTADEMVDDMIDLNRIEGRVKASTVRRIGEMVEKHPEDVVAIIRNWLYQET